MIRIGIATLVATLSTSRFNICLQSTCLLCPRRLKRFVIKLQRWTLRNATAEEQRVLDYFQDYGITDKAALAVLLGNIKQESKFNTESVRVVGTLVTTVAIEVGLVLIQWTTPGRYAGLKRYAANNRCDIHSLECQLGYVTHEVEWRKAEHGFKRTGNSINGYMHYAKRWLGWGVHGASTTYAQPILQSVD
jgi:hypothetical protein